MTKDSAGGLRERILEYLQSRYQPMALILYGSFADGSSGPGSDFDALLITDEPQCFTGGRQPRHDDSLIEGVVLDVFIYPPEALQGSGFEPADFLQLHDGQVLLDRGGLAAGLVERVRAYLDSLPKKTPEELRQSLAWCRKMLARAGRGDAEGSFRLHWLLVDSLELFCDILGQPYLGPKKALRLMAERYGVAQIIYNQALRETRPAVLKDWIDYLTLLNEMPVK